MPAKLVSVSKGVEYQLIGRVTMKDLLDVSKAFYQSDIKGWHFIIADLTQLESLELEEDDVDVFAGLDAGFDSMTRNMKMAFVVNDDQFMPLVNAYIDKMNNRGTSWHFKITHDLSDAKTWVTKS